MSDVITTANDLQKACAILAQAPVMAFDTEFIRESTFFPNLALIQVATDKDVFLIDPLAFKKGALAPLQTVLTNPAILKILHSAQADQECLLTTYGFLAAPIFDTSVAASLLGFGDQIGLGRLLEQTVNVTIAKGHSRTNWLQRPLPTELIRYAREDVSHLVASYRALEAQLKKSGRLDWALQLAAEWVDPGRFAFNAVDTAARIGKRKRMDARGLSCLARLLDWRERVAREINVPRRRVADDQALIDLATAHPTDAGHLHSFRGISRSAMARHTDELLAICANMAVILELAAVRSEKTHDSLEDRLAIEFFQFAVKVLGQHHRLSARHLLDREAAEKIVFGKFSSPEEWVSTGLLAAETHQMIGQQLWEFLNGKLSLTLFDGQIKAV
jgi:ribonuclease D